MRTNQRELKKDRPIVGPVLAVIAALHLGTTGVFYGAEWATIIDSGMVNAITTPEVDAAFWWVAAGLGMVMVASLAWLCEARTGRLPVPFAVLLLFFTAFGVVLMPASGFWLFLIPAVIIGVQAALASQRRESVSPITSAAN